MRITRTQWKRWRIPVLLTGVLCATAWVCWLGSQETYSARTLITIEPGDRFLGSGFLDEDRFYIGGSTSSMCGVDRHGRIYLAVERGPKQGVLVYRPNGQFEREVRLRKELAHVGPTLNRALEVSPSGERLWTVYLRVGPGNDRVGDLVVCCFSSATGFPVRSWPVGQGGVLLFTSVGEDGAYLWSDRYPKYPIVICSFGQREASIRSFDGAYPYFDESGLVWNARVEREANQARTDRRDTPKLWVSIWRGKPGGNPKLYCRALVPGYGGVVPFGIDAAGSIYVWTESPDVQGPLNPQHKSVYRIFSDGSVRLLFSTSDLVHFQERSHSRVGRWFGITRDGSVLFESRAKGRDDPGGLPYRIYKATPTRRWRVWLRKLGMG